MISRPTTEQIILDCRRELMDVILPAVSDPAVSLAVQMLENVMRNVATRAAHEIAWMTEETEDMLNYGRYVAAEIPSPALDEALEAAAGQARASLHLDDVVKEYSAAGEVFSCALEASLQAGHEKLVAKGVELLQARTEREQQIKGDWAMIGRG